MTSTGSTAKDKRLLVVVNWRDLRHPEAGGAEVVCENLAERLGTDDTDVVLLAAAVDGQPREEVRPNYRVVRGGSRYTVYLHALFWLLRHRRRICAVIDSQNGIPFFTPLVLPRRTPILLLLHHVHQDQFQKYFGPVMTAVGKWLEGPACRRVYGSRMILTVSPSTRAGARRTLGLRGEIRVTPPGWTLDGEPAQTPRSTAPTVVSVGRLVPHKRTHLLIEAMPTLLAHAPDASLHVVGRGPEAERLADLAERLGVSAAVHFHAGLDNAAKEALVSASWVCVNTSQGEGWGLSVIEANALGVPCVAYRVPGLRDSIVDGRTGRLLEEGADLGLALAEFLSLLRDGEKAATFRAQSVAWAAEFSWDGMAGRITAAIEAERNRLELRHADRRTGTDLYTVVRVDRVVLPDDWEPSLRVGDHLVDHGGSVSMLLAGADTSTVVRMLTRSGIAEADITAPWVVIEVARAAHHMSQSLVPAAGTPVAGAALIPAQAGPPLEETARVGDGAHD